MTVFQSTAVKIKKKALTRFLIWEGEQTANHTQRRRLQFSISRDFFIGQRYRRMTDQKLGPRLACNLDFAKRKGLEPRVEKVSKVV